METQSQGHLRQAGEITSLRNKWRGAGGREAVIGFSEVAIIFDLGQILYLPWSLAPLSVKWDPSGLVLPTSLGGGCDPMDELHKMRSEEEGSDSRKLRNAEAYRGWTGYRSAWTREGRWKASSPPGQQRLSALNMAARTPRLPPPSLPVLFQRSSRYGF